MREGEIDTNKNKSHLTGKASRGQAFLSALERHGNGDKSAISKELRKLALSMRNIKKNDEKSPVSPVKTKQETDDKQVSSLNKKNDFSQIDDFILAEGEKADLTIDDIIRSGMPSGDYFSENDLTFDESENESPQIISIDSFLTAVKNGDLKSACVLSDDDDVCETSYCNDDYNESEDMDESFFTESLAKIYIKQRLYDKALKIISKLSLIYPEKNIYFADQIRFLKKLIDNIKTE